MAEMIRRYWVHALTVLVAGALVLAPGAAAARLSQGTGAFLDVFGWLVLAASTGALGVCAALAISKAGRIRLGGPEARPEFSAPTWFMMLFAAGMGAGLVFWGAAEPVIHSLTPPPGSDLTPGTDAAVREVMAITLLHWALHPWAIYGVGAVAIGVFGFRTGGATLRPSAALGATGPAAAVVDQIALFAVVFGIVASLGQGVLQIAAGVDTLAGREPSETLSTTLTILAVLFVFYMASAATGLQRGIKWLSEANLVLAGLLLLFIAIAGPTVFALNITLSSLGDYLARLPDLAFELRAHVGADEAEHAPWTQGWTLTYFLWWIAWIPFVGVFIARISYGRTVREVVLGVLIAPSLFTLLWFGILGGAALHAQLVQGVDLGVSDFLTAPQATYALLETLPLAPLTQAATVVLVFIFLATSADSGSYVLAMLSEHRTGEPPVGERLFWGVAMAALTAGALFTGGGQNTMRALAVAGGVPMLFLMIAMGVRLVRRAAGGERESLTP